MKEEELFSKKTFIDLLKLDYVDRIEKEDKLFLEAERLGLGKRFKESLKKYKEVLNDKISIGTANLVIS